ncbi:hypothetical protein Patl1_05430 [Pistacia atlantica]|uniref:Uncharacterized protein n=1 Tax=Pistacia atlantica TaxID=434234 RepID=A0ACC1BPX4_9ROSI|nr:hypothetical protein Patl1_05430 [Pistacia atlantica]
MRGKSFSLDLMKEEHAAFPSCMRNTEIWPKRLLNLEKDTACFCLCKDQQIAARQKKSTIGASHLSLSLETCNNITRSHNSSGENSRLWKCVELKDVSIEATMASTNGVRLDRGMNYAEVLLYRFRILGPDGGLGEGLSKGLKHSSAGPLSKFFKASPLIVENLQEGGSSRDGLLQLGFLDDVDVSVKFRGWLFALEGAKEMAERWWFYNQEDMNREESVEGLQILKPHVQKGLPQAILPANGFKESVERFGGINLEVHLVILGNNTKNEMVNWMVENLKFSKKPIG